ncbi:MAG TPA: antitoxin Xre/MbcA/ParS toxin-binding domain-containing protein [Candidatus Binataceae bacterium]|nr:antitoxin Xre/MbcA/ParS toxin-binding domain-containing protein [Candidatus Binataceae bacterium]
MGNLGTPTPSERPALPRRFLAPGDAQVVLQRVPLARRELQGRVTGPVRLIQVLARAWALSNAELAALLAYPSETLIPGLLEGRVTFAPDSDRADRVRIMYSMHATLADLFVDGENEARWLRDRLPILENLSPLECMLQKRIPGMLMVQDLVERKMANR